MVDVQLNEELSSVVYESMLTTIDNPYNPFTQFDEWLAYDTLKGYNTSGILANFTITSEELSEYDQTLAINTAIDEIVTENGNGMFKKVTRKLES